LSAARNACSDFPYFRLPNPESSIGRVVTDELKDNWQLHIEGDEVNLPRILAQVPRVDPFHYDSDKSYSGRSFAVNLIREKLAADGLIVMDDVTDNAWFVDAAEQHGRACAVFGDPRDSASLGGSPIS
jgi:hypothetical protein